MKKILTGLLCILLLLTGCGKAQKISGRIAHIYGGTLLIAGEDGELYSAAAGGADTAGEKLSPGQYVEITYAEGIMETYPAQLGEVREIRMAGESSNIVEVFVKMIGELLAEELHPMTMLAYDFGETEILTEGERQAVGYICWTELDAEPVFGTKEELIEQGIILGAEGEEYLPEGWLLTFAADEEQPDLLRITLWRNDETEMEAAYHLSEEAGEWHYEIAEG